MAMKYCQYFFLYWYWYGLYFYLEVLIEVLAILFKPIIIQYFLAILFFKFCCLYTVCINYVTQDNDVYLNSDITDV